VLLLNKIRIGKPKKIEFFIRIMITYMKGEGGGKNSEF